MTVLLRTGSGPRWAAGLAIPMLLAALALSSCSVREDLLFEGPAAEVVLYGELSKAAVPAGTLYTGWAINNGGLDAENTTVLITVYGGGGTSLGTYSGPVGVGIEDEEVDDTLPPDERGYFSVTVPVGLGAIVSETVSFTWTEPVEEEL